METSPNNQRVSVIADFDYAAQAADELTLRVGDVVRDVERLPGGWWRGELRGRKGLFPDNLVSVCRPDRANRSEGVSGRCKVAFSYQPANLDELALTVGDTLEVLGEVEEGWWQGRTRQGKVGVFPSNFVVLMERSARPVSEDAPKLPPKPVKEQCRVLFPYTAMNEDELTLQEGDVVTLVSREGPDRGWWRGELRGRQGLFPDNFVTVIPPAATEVEEKKPDRPPAKNLYPVLNKYSEKTASVKELTTSKTSMRQETTISKETSLHKEEKVTHGSRSEQERSVVIESSRSSTDEAKILDTPDSTGKKPPVPSKKSPTPPSGVGGLFSGLKNKLMSSTDKLVEKTTTISSSTSSSSGEWDKLDGIGSSKPVAPAAPAATPAPAPAAAAPPTDGFDHVERNSILNDPRAGRVKAPRRRPPSQALRDDTPQLIGLSNGQHDATTEKTEKSEPVKPKAREWEKHKAPWMEELKLNQAKKTSLGDTGKSRSTSTSSEGPGSKAGGGSTDKLLECGIDEEKHTMDMSKSMSSISGRLSVIETFEETRTHTRHSLDSNKKEAPPPLPTTDPPAAATAPTAPAPTLNSLHSPTAAGRTLITMLDDIKKPPAPAPPVAGVRTSADLSHSHDKSQNHDISSSHDKSAPGLVERQSTSERVVIVERSGDRKECSDNVLIAQLNDRIANLERLVEVQCERFATSIEELSLKLAVETKARLTLQAELEKLAHCVTQV